MINELKKELKNIKGNILLVGVEDDILLKKIDKLKNITSTNYIYQVKKKNKSKIKNNTKEKTINLKKLKKYYSKKSLDTIIVNYNTVKKYINYFISGTMFTNKGYTYMYGISEDIDVLIQKYQKYGVKIEVKQDKDQFLLIIKNKIDYNYFQDKKYILINSTLDIIDIIANVLMN